MKAKVFLAGLIMGLTQLSAASGEDITPHECSAIELSGYQISIDDMHLTLQRDGEVRDAIELPLSGSGWRCLSLTAFEEQNLIVLEWHEGEAGTYAMYYKTDLMAFYIQNGVFEQSASWVLTEGVRGQKGTDVIADKQYTLILEDGALHILFSGNEKHVFYPN